MSESFNLGGLLNRSCTPTNKQPDLETGCGPYCQDGHQAAYEQCHQAFFVKQQNQVLQQQLNGIKNSELDLLKQKNTEMALDLESARQEFRNLIEQHDKELAFRNTVDYGIAVAFLLIGAIIFFRKFRVTSRLQL